MEHPSQDVINAAEAKITAALGKEWPEDDWEGIGNDWDLNLYLDDDTEPETKTAVLYPVKNGNTDTSFPAKVWTM